MPELYYIFKLIGTEHNTDSWYWHAGARGRSGCGRRC